MDYRKKIAKRISFDDIMEVLYAVQHSDTEKEKLYRLIFDEDKKVVRNALWIMGHFSLGENEWLYVKHHELINEAMSVSDDAARRLLLTLLERQPFSASDIRTDFFDFCMKHAMMVSEPVSVKVLCLKLAFAMSVHFRELRDELRSELEIMSDELLAPSVRCCRRNLLKKMNSYDKNNNTI